MVERAVGVQNMGRGSKATACIPIRRAHHGLGSPTDGTQLAHKRFALDQPRAVHAGVRPGIALERQSANDLLRIRGPFLSTPHGLGKCVVFGHTPFPDVRRDEDKVGIDTGACYQGMGYGKLTAFCLQTQETFQAE